MQLKITKFDRKVKKQKNTPKIIPFKKRDRDTWGGQKWKKEDKEERGEREREMREGREWERER